MNFTWKLHADDSCPSCLALAGQTHTDQQWADFGVTPGHHKLYCRDNCKCALTPTDDDESGDLSTVPLRTDITERTLSMQTSKEITLQATATPTDSGFQILAINAGEAKGHGITFSEASLQDALTLYNNKPVFIDHAGLGNAPSVRNLAGTISGASWNHESRGIEATLRPMGPAAEVLLSLRDAAKADPAIMETVGFSTVLNVKLNAKGEVLKVTRVKSVDVVIDPARGGKFLSAYLGQKGEDHMSEEITKEQTALSETQAAALELQGASEIIADLQEKQRQALALQVEQCRALLDTSLAASKLPAASQKAVRKPFDAMLAEGKPFPATELKTAIEDKREELAALQENVQGPARAVSAMFTGTDDYKAALADLLGAPREEGMHNRRVRPISLREAYILATGDQYLMGGFYQEHQLVSANFPGIVADLLNKVLVKAWDDFRASYGWWEKIVTVEHFTNLQDVKWLKTGTIASLPTVAERGEYQELPIGDNKETSDWYKYGGYIPLTLESVINDDVRAFRRMPREAALAGMRNISEQVAYIFTQASGAGPTLADTGALFNATAVTTAGGHANLLTTALGTDYTAWNAVAAAVYNQPLLVKNETGKYGTGKKQAIDPKYCLVPRALTGQAQALFMPRWASVVDSIASSGGPTYAGAVEVLTVPEWTDATDWAAVVDPNLMSGIMIGEIFGLKPQIFSAASEIDPAMFANDESRIKVRQFLTVGVADFRPLHKSNVA